MVIAGGYSNLNNIRECSNLPLVKATIKDGQLGLIGGWNNRMALVPVVLKLKAISPFLQPGTSMYDCDVVNVTTQRWVSRKNILISIHVFINVNKSAFSQTRFMPERHSEDVAEDEAQPQILSIHSEFEKTRVVFHRKNIVDINVIVVIEVLQEA